MKRRRWFRQLDTGQQRHLSALETENASLRAQNEALLREYHERDVQRGRQAEIIFPSAGSSSVQDGDVVMSRNEVYEPYESDGGEEVKESMASARIDHDMEVDDVYASEGSRYESSADDSPSDSEGTDNSLETDSGGGFRGDTTDLNSRSPTSPVDADQIARRTFSAFSARVRKGKVQSNLSYQTSGVPPNLQASSYRYLPHKRLLRSPDNSFRHRIKDEERETPGHSRGVFEANRELGRVQRARMGRGQNTSHPAHNISVPAPTRFIAEDFQRQVLEELELIHEVNDASTCTISSLQDEIESLQEEMQALRATPSSSSTNTRRVRNRNRTPNATGRFLRTKPSAPRGDKRNTLMKDVRLFMNPLIGIQKDRDVIGYDMSVFPTEEEVRGFVLSDGDPPEITDLLPIYWDDIPSTWNRVLAQQFTELFITEKPDYATRQEEVTEHFWQRLDTLKYRFRRAQQQSGETVSDWYKRNQNNQENEHARIRKRTRREQLYKDREQAAAEASQACMDSEQKKNWVLALDAIRRLGVAGMSSDDSELGSSYNRRYLVKNRKWRSGDLLEVLKCVDSAIPVAKASVHGNVVPGNRPRVRERPRRPIQSNRAAVAQLPYNFYHRAWYKSLSAVEKNELAATRPILLPDPDA
ncbi:hypothetical protein V5O48_003787 [Marasmius crinis-equi]|uniref:Uncharacterized protein n=1 Tax=Marasmius crinis-equi TaxID=585013 RepID=A0ABR3FS54_9AGAR